MYKKLIAIILALLVTAGAATYIAQQETPVEPTISEVETPAESPVEGGTAVEGQLNADETTATGKLDGSAGENVYDMTNYMESLTDSNSGTKVDQEYAFDLEEQKQETPVEEGTVGSDIGSNVGGSVGAGSGTGAGNGGTQQSTGNSGNSGASGNQGQQTQAPSDGKFNSKESVEALGSVKEVTGYNEELGGWVVDRDTGHTDIILPNGSSIEYDVAKALGLIK